MATESDAVIEKGTVYRITPVDGSDHMYIGATMKTLEERMRVHRNSLSVRALGKCNTRLYRTMAEKGPLEWNIERLVSLHSCTRDDLRQLEKRFIRLLKPDLNTRNGILSEEKCRYERIRSSKPWRCYECSVTITYGGKRNHLRSAKHLAICLD